MTWALVAALGVLVVVLMGQAVTIASLRIRVKEAENLVSDVVEVAGPLDSYVSGRLRMYASRWGQVIRMKGNT